MKLTIKTLQQSTFKVDIEPDKTVKELKDKIETDHGKEYPSGAQRLIYSGKILADDSKLAEYNIDEKKFIVLMITRQPPAPAPKPAETEKAALVKKEEQTAGVKPKGSADSKQAAKSSVNTPQSSSTSSTTTVSAANTTSTAPATPNTNTGQQSATATATATRHAASIMSDVSDLSSEPQMASRLASIMTQPHFRQIQDLIQQSPHLLSSTIESLAATDPDMYNFITENPDLFVSALNHPPLGRNNTARSSTMDARARQGTPQQAGRLPSGRQQPIVDQLLGDISEHDKEAIERLKELGFSEYLAVQAYMACDRDEQLAANLLLQMDS